MKRGDRAAAEDLIRQRFQTLAPSLNERGRRLLAASEAIAYGYGGVAAVARATGMATSSIGRGKAESLALEAGSATPLALHRSRAGGAGRKPATVKDPELLPALKALVESSTRGDPMSPLLWTSRSLRKLVAALKEQGHIVGMKVVARLLRELGYSLQANRKRHEGAGHPDRDKQFAYLNDKMGKQLDANEPAVSVDTKKKELVGNYKNAGQELRPKGDPLEVKAYDFVDPALGRASPYGVYDIKQNEAWVSVGISHDTGEFAVQTIRTWWCEMGRERYPNAKSLLITADCGGSNGSRLRLWKVELQMLADDLGFPITVCHLPPGTSKWNKIEHKLFSFITQNWRGKPLVTHQVIVSLISNTTTKSGLIVKSHIDKYVYAKGRRVTAKNLARVNLTRHDFHGDWNYTISPGARA